MKKIVYSITMALAIVLLVACQSNSKHNVNTKKVVVATAGNIRPFSYQDNGKLTGYDIEVIRAASKYIKGYDISFKITAWDSIFVGMDSGKFQIAANNLSYTKERASKYLYSIPIATNPLVLVVPKNSSISKLDDIAGKTTQDDTGTSTIEYSGEDVSKRLLDLSNGEFDYLIFDKVSVETIIKQNRYDFKVIELDTGSNPNNYILFSNENNELQRQFNQAVKKLYSDGTLKKLSEKYLGGDYIPEKKEMK